MSVVIDFLKTDLFVLILAGLNLILIIAFIVNSVSVKKIKQKYNSFMRKLGNGTDLETIMKDYINKVEDVGVQNKEIIKYCETLNKDMNLCVQKVGIVRYSAFKDTGSDLSFALALLDKNNNGVVLNGIYSREMSNIYAKTVENGKSSYTLSEEEQQAIGKAVGA